MRSSASRLFATLTLAAGTTIAGAPARLPERVEAFARELPRIVAGMEELVATERMTQMVMDSRSDRVMRRQVLVSDYQIAPLEEDPSVLWEFRFVKEMNGKPVPGADHQIEDFLRLRHTDAREERLKLAQLGFSRSLPGTYWHNLTLLLLAFAGENAANFDWKGDGDRFTFEQVRGPGIPESLFDPKSPRHYPKGSLTLAGGTLSRLEIEWASGPLLTNVSLEFSPPPEPGDIPRPARYVARKRYAGASPKTLVETIFEYRDYKRFRATAEAGN